ncbi:Uncharacterised protein [Mycobacterium tuberculosis]|nr:Uncharacterised protein [Mycobacterium tuberculosis]
MRGRKRDVSLGRAHNARVSVWAMLAECVGQLDEPFRRSEIIGWFRRHYPQVKESTLAAHIQAATANADNRDRNHPYLARRAPLLQRIDHGLYQRATPPGAVPAATPAESDGRPGPGDSGPAAPQTAAYRPVSERGRDRTRLRIDALVHGFGDHVRRFEAEGLFSGPSVYFHHRAIARRRAHTSVTGLLADERFLEYVYAVLPSWGMHRMGPQPAKVAEFADLVASLRAAVPMLEELWPLHIARLPPGSVDEVAGRVWQVIAGLRASTPGTQIVAGSKTLHHVLPDLVPPIDRQYTVRFFTGGTTLPTDDQRAFSAIFPALVEIAERSEQAIDRALERGGVMATGPTKVIDNAIIGFMQTRNTQPSTT